MPLIIMAGLPASGKTTIANEVAEYFRNEHGKTVHVVNEEALSLDRNTSLKDGRTEKNYRASLKSSAERQLVNDDIVILDSGNFIKGYRYELWCAARAVKHAMCVIYVETSPDTCRQWNKARQDQSACFNDTVMEDLLRRMETPNPGNRWDSPCINVRPESEKIRLEDVRAAVLDGKSARTSFATQKQFMAQTNTLHDITSILQTIVKDIVQAQNDGAAPGSTITPRHCKEPWQLPRGDLNMAQLRRLKAQFLTILKQRPPSADNAGIGDQFLRHITTQL